MISIYLSMTDRITSGIKPKHLARGPLVWIARIGYLARGIVFLLIGTFALLAAGGGERPKGARDALEFAFQRPLGAYFLWTLAAGLLCFAGWRLLQSVFDADRHGNDSYGLMRRAALGGSALFYLRSPPRPPTLPSRSAASVRISRHAIGRHGLWRSHSDSS